MADLTNHAENLLATWLMTSSAVTRPSSLYLALFNAGPGETGGGTECSGTGYARAAITFTVSGAVASGPTSEITFTAAADWNTLTHWAVMDASTGGNMLFREALAASVVATAGLPVKAQVNQFTLTFD